MSDALPPTDELRRLLYTPVLSDVLDSFGLLHQALRPFVRPIDESLVLLGRVRTGRYQLVAGPPAPGDTPYLLEMELIDSLKPGEVAVLACGGPTEFRLLQFLMERPGTVFSREELLNGVWGPDIYVEPRTVDVHIRRLRKALNIGDSADVIRTVRAAGYSLDANGEVA